jgi:hypothetical protein
MTDRDIYKAAIDIWGQESQVWMLFEEMSELQKALCKYRRSPTSDNLVNVNEEMADVDIMMDQMRVMFGEEVPAMFKIKKLKRLETLIENERSNIE